jgi:hypothetical protein
VCGLCCAVMYWLGGWGVGGLGGWGVGGGGSSYTIVSSALAGEDQSGVYNRALLAAYGRQIA